jgi:hypothetical protein
MKLPINFSETNIAELFGHEAAEDESPTRLRQYYFRNQAYDQVTAELPLRILVGHKGIGKSALFRIAMHEDHEAQKLAIEVRPDDVNSIHTKGLSFNEQIAAWKAGLHKIIGEKSLEGFTIPALKKTGAIGKDVIKWVAQTASPLLSKHITMEPTKQKIIERFLSERKIVIYMDDLDRGWEGQRADIIRISALLNAARDLCRDSIGLSFRIALRSDVYYLVRTSDESTDKIGGSVVWYKWTNHEILALLVKRVESFFGRTLNEIQLLKMSQADLAEKLKNIITDRFQGEGKWRDVPIYRVIMSLIRRRPRDLVKLLTLAARKANEDKSNLIETRHFRAIFEEYSQDRLQDTVNEYRSELPDVQRLMLGMRPNRRERKTRAEFFYNTAELLSKINDIVQGGAFIDAKGKSMTNKELAAFLYKINFLIASREKADGYIDRKYFEENRYISPEIADFGYSWEVHPAYRWALQPEDRTNIFNQVGISDDED